MRDVGNSSIVVVRSGIRTEHRRKTRGRHDRHMKSPDLIREGEISPRTIYYVYTKDLSVRNELKQMDLSARLITEVKQH